MLTDTLKDANENGVIEVDDVEKTADLIFILVEGAYYYLSMVSDKSEYDSRIEHYQKTVLIDAESKECSFFLIAINCKNFNRGPDSISENAWVVRVGRTS